MGVECTQRWSVLLVTIASLIGSSGCGRSPLDLAHRISGLAIPSDARIVTFRDEASGAFNQDLDLHVELELGPDQFKQLADQAIALGYEEIGVDPAADSLLVARDSVNQFGVSETGIHEALDEIGDAGGLFRYSRESPSSYSYSVLDPARRRLVVRAIIL